MINIITTLESGVDQSTSGSAVIHSPTEGDLALTHTGAHTSGCNFEMKGEFPFQADANTFGIGFNRLVGGSWYDDDGTDGSFSLSFYLNIGSKDVTYEASSWGYGRPIREGLSFQVLLRRSANPPLITVSDDLTIADIVVNTDTSYLSELNRTVVTMTSNEILGGIDFNMGLEGETPFVTFRIMMSMAEICEILTVFHLHSYNSTPTETLIDLSMGVDIAGREFTGVVTDGITGVGVLSNVTTISRSTQTVVDTVTTDINGLFSIYAPEADYHVMYSADDYNTECIDLTPDFTDVLNLMYNKSDDGVEAPDFTSIVSGNVQKLGQPYGADVVVMADSEEPRVVGYGVSDPVTGDYSIDVAPWISEVLIAVVPDYGIEFYGSSFVELDAVIHPTIPNGYVYRVTQSGLLSDVEPTWDTTLDVLSGDAVLSPELLHRPLMNAFVRPEVDDSLIVHRGKAAKLDAVVDINGVDYNRYVGVVDTDYIVYLTVDGAESLTLTSGSEWLIPNGDFGTGDTTGWDTTLGTSGIANRTRSEIAKNVVYGASCLELGMTKNVLLSDLIVGLGLPSDCVNSVINDPALLGFGLRVTCSSWSNQDSAQSTLILNSTDSQLAAVSSELEVHSSIAWTDVVIEAAAVSDLKTLVDFDVELYCYRVGGSNNDGYMTDVTLTVL